MISLLVAYTKKDRVIGSGGKIPWNLPSERIRFKAICAGKKVIIGRKSFDEIGHALSYCTLVIVSKKMKEAPEGCLLAKSFEEAVEICAGKKELLNDADVLDEPAEEILVAGGGEIYKKALPFASRVYATEIHAEFDGDTFFPPLNESEWDCKKEESHSDNGTEYDYLTFSRRRFKSSTLA
ncbi:MAG: dihydrofolate reductase [Treponema sp.]|nr:dihydrofolate reductase [Treponema sp.]